MIRYVCGFLFDQHQEEVVLILKEKPAWQKGKFNGVGGKIEDGESPIEAMCREFKEETGMICKKWNCFLEYYGQAGEDPYIVYFYRAFSSLEDFIVIKRHVEELVMPDEQVSIQNVYPLPSNVIYNLNWIIPLALDPSVRKTIVKE